MNFRGPKSMEDSVRERGMKGHSNQTSRKLQGAAQVFQQAGCGCSSVARVLV